MLARFKPYITSALVVLTLVIVGVVGHRHWLVSTPQLPTATEQPRVVAKPRPTPVVKQQKTVRKAKPSSKPQPRRECDASGWCWTYY